MSTCIGIGIGIPFRRMGAGIDAQAQAHYNRVIADGGLIPSGLVGVNNFFKTVKAIYGTSDITTAISVGLDAQVLGYKLGAGAGTTAGQAAQKLYSCSGSSGDVVQTTAASQPLLLVHSGANYWWSGGSTTGAVNAPNISIPTSSGMSIEVKVLFTTNDDSVNTSGWICSNDNGAGSRSLFLGFSGTRTLILYWANLSRVATATAQIPSAFNGWVKATLETSGGNMLAKFFTSTDGITYTQLGSTITNSGGANTFQTTSAPLWVTGNTGANNILGKIFRVIYKDANGITRADFNPSQYNPANSQTQWVSTSGETWTINVGTASGGYKGAVITRATMQSDGIDDRMTTTASRGNTNTQYTTFSALSADGTGDKIIIDATSANYRNSIAQLNNDIYLWMNNAVSNVSTAKTLRTIGTIITSNNAGVKNSIDLNNGTETTNAYTPTPSGTGISLFSRSDGGAGAFSNSLFTSYVSSKTQDTTTQQSAMFSFLKTFSNY